MTRVLLWMLFGISAPSLVSTCSNKISAPVECAVDVLSPVSDAVSAIGDSVLLGDTITVSWTSTGSCYQDL